jgi:phosphotransferase system HPr (HPr) family protein
MNSETKDVKIEIPEGVHLRVAAKVVEICREGNSKVYLSCRDCPQADACSVLSVLLLGASQGDVVTISAEGHDAKEVVDKLSGYFSDGGGI